MSIFHTQPMEYLTTTEGTQIPVWGIDTAGKITKLCNLPRVLSRNVQEQQQAFIARCLPAFAYEPTFVMQHFGIPSVIIRVDSIVSTVSGFEEDMVLEFEDRPQAIGILSVLSEDFRQRLLSIISTWGSLADFLIVQSPSRPWSDDSWWVGSERIVTLEQALCIEKPVIVRASPYEEVFHLLQGRSLSTIATEGDKRYGFATGLWQLVTSAEEIPAGFWENGFVLKELQETMSEGVYLFQKDFRRNQGGSVTQGKIIQVLSEHPEGMYLQPFYMPMASGFIDCPYSINRTVWAFNFQTYQFEIVGGGWLANSGIKIHGTNRALWGPLILE